MPDGFMIPLSVAMAVFVAIGGAMFKLQQATDIRQDTALVTVQTQMVTKNEMETVQRLIKEGNRALCERMTRLEQQTDRIEAQLDRLIERRFPDGGRDVPRE